jgi:AraC-like DNA-binding protein
MAVAEPSQLAEKLSQSHILQDYERAFSEATGLPLKFAPAGRRRAGMRGSEKANPFCTTMAETEPGCRMCVDMQDRLAADESGTSQTAACIANLTDSAIPVRVGEKVLGYLQTGQVALRQLTRDDFRRVTEFLKKGGAEVDWATLEHAYFETKVISRKQYMAVVRLLEVFAQHLSLAAEQIATQQAHPEPPMVERARALIEERHAEELSLIDVARAVNASTFHFCKMFKKATGMTFTEYLSLVRVAKAKKLLANPQARISEIAYEAGFASLTHFNRMFKRITGQSPSEFRQKVCGQV